MRICNESRAKAKIVNSSAHATEIPKYRQVEGGCASHSIKSRNFKTAILYIVKPKVADSRSMKRVYLCSLPPLDHRDRSHHASPTIQNCLSPQFHPPPNLTVVVVVVVSHSNVFCQFAQFHPLLSNRHPRLRGS